MPSPDANRMDPASGPILGHDGSKSIPASTALSEVESRLGIAVLHCVPLDQPDQVHQLTPALYQHYEVEKGSVSLAGCLLEDVPFVHVEFTDQSGNEEGATEVYWDIAGSEVSSEQIVQLGLIDPAPLDQPPPAINPRELDQWLVSFLAQLGHGEGEAGRQIEKCTLIWCKKASGKVMLAIDGKQATIPFSGWARDLLLGKQKPPPFECSHTGRKSYRVTLTDAGQLTVPEAIKTCAKSGRRVLETELKECSASGRLVLPEFLVRCEATGAELLRDRLETCSACGQKVSPRAMETGACSTCRQLAEVGPNNSTVRQLVEAHPELGRFKTWRKSESEGSIIVEGSSWRGKTRIRLAKESGKIQQVAKRTPLSRHWKTVDPTKW